jgi:hypothetical protein
MRIYIKYLFIAFIIGLVSTNGFAQKRKIPKTAAASMAGAMKKKPKSAISFTENNFEFGHIKQGDVVKHDFVFQNTGTKALEILSCTASCGCTSPDYPFIPIAPGEKSMVSVTFDSKHKAGHQKPAVTIVTNGDPKITVIYLEGFVE